MPLVFKIHRFADSGRLLGQAFARGLGTDAGDCCYHDIIVTPDGNASYHLEQRSLHKPFQRKLVFENG